VRGRVVSVTTSPLGTTFINFGGEYPNQTFAGFIAAGVRNSGRSATYYDPRENRQRHRHNREGKPEINVVSANQIKVLDSQTEQ